MHWKRQLRYLHLRFVRLRGTPEEISRGFACGIFWGMFPLPGLQMAIAILTAVLLRGSKLAAAAGTWLSNPLTTLPLTVLNVQVGQVVRGHSLDDLATAQIQSPSALLEVGGDLLLSYLLGCLINGFLAAMIFYWIGIPLVRSVQNQRLKQRQRRSLRRSKQRSAESLRLH